MSLKLSVRLVRHSSEAITQVIHHSPKPRPSRNMVSRLHTTYRMPRAERQDKGQSTTQATSGFKVTDWVDPNNKSGEFKRQVSSFRNFVSREPGAKFPAEKGRYHLYVSYACPWVSSGSASSESRTIWLISGLVLRLIGP